MKPKIKLNYPKEQKQKSKNNVQRNEMQLRRAKHKWPITLYVCKKTWTHLGAVMAGCFLG